MKIVGGRFRGRNLATPDGRNTRPTSNQTRESLFNILDHAPWSPGVEGAIVADIFAGSGALGFEAISRGAEYCLFVETDARARAAIRENIEAMELFGATRVFRRDATRLKIPPSNLRGPFDLAFLDPPYGKGLAEPAVRALVRQGLMADGGVFVIEETAEAELDLAGLELLDRRVWGAAQVVFARGRKIGAEAEQSASANDSAFDESRARCVDEALRPLGERQE